MQSLSTKIGLGLLGGLAGLVAMELIKRATAPLAKRAPERTDDSLTGRSMSPLGPQHQPNESPTDAVGRIGYEKLAGDAPSRATKSKLSWAVHVGYGLLVAGLYNAIRGGRSRPLLRTIGEGAAYGAGLWLLGDELAVPLLGLSDKPSTQPRAKHLQSLAQHLGFGVVTAATTHALGHRRHGWLS
jgi:uncharacterized membrane protein YagU involved in acid resistance